LKVVLAQIFCGQIGETFVVFNEQDSCFHGLIMAGWMLKFNFAEFITASHVECRARVWSAGAIHLESRQPSMALLSTDSEISCAFQIELFSRY
ncbi:MAG: hypothetical protein KA779_14725, partial [Propionivibrio sp.]|nr:hypothetical protein [Propionivibrio sp.]